MAKESGLGWTKLEIDDSGGTNRDVKNDVTSLEFATPREVQEVTGIDKSAYERLLLLADFTFSCEGVFNDAASTGIHTVLKTVGSFNGNRTVTLTVSGQTLANECVFDEFSVSRSDGGELTCSASASLSDGAVPTWT